MGVRLGDMGYALIGTQDKKGEWTPPTDVLFLEDNSPIESVYDVVKQNVQIGSLASVEAAIGYGLAKAAGQATGPLVINAGIEAIINAFGTGVHHKGTDASGDDQLWTITAQVNDPVTGISTVTITGNVRNTGDAYSSIWNLPRPGQAVIVNPNSLGNWQPGAILAAISDLATTHHAAAGSIPAYDEVTGLELGLLPPPSDVGLTGSDWVGYTMCSVSMMRLLTSPQTPRPWSSLELARAGGGDDGGYADKAQDSLFSSIEFAGDKEHWKTTYDVRCAKPLSRIGGAYAATAADLFAPTTADLEDLFQLMLVQGSFLITSQDDTRQYPVVSAAAVGQVVTLTFAAATFANPTHLLGKRFIAANLNATAGSVVGANGEYVIQAATSNSISYTAIGTVSGTFDAAEGSAAIYDEHPGLVPTAETTSFKLDNKALELGYIGHGAYDTGVGGQEITLAYKYDNRADRPMEREEIFENVGYVKTRRVLMGCLLPGQPGAGTASGVAGISLYVPRAAFDMPKYGAPIGKLQSVDVTMKAKKYGNNPCWGEWTLSGVGATGETDAIADASWANGVLTLAIGAGSGSSGVGAGANPFVVNIGDTVTVSDSVPAGYDGDYVVLTTGTDGEGDVTITVALDADPGDYVGTAQIARQKAYYMISNAGTPVAQAECWIANAMVDTEPAGTPIGLPISTPFS